MIILKISVIKSYSDDNSRKITVESNGGSKDSGIHVTSSFGSSLSQNSAENKEKSSDIELDNFSPDPAVNIEINGAFIDDSRSEVNFTVPEHFLGQFEI